MTIRNVQNGFAAKGLAIVPLRLMLGFGFAAHGYAKLSRGPESFAAILAAIGVPQPHLMAWVTCLIEFVGGISVMAGAFVLPISLPLAGIMLTAPFSVHLQYGFSSVRLKAVSASGAEFGPIGYEMNLLYLAGLLTLAIGGSGSLSINHWLAMRSKAQPTEGGARSHPERIHPVVSDVCIRFAQLSDRDQLLRMREALWTNAPAEELARELTLILEGNAPVTLPLVILVAVAAAGDGTLAGFLEVDLRSHADGCNPSRPVGYVEGWYVAEKYRHQGIGRKLLAAAEDWARNQGCIEIASDTWVDNEVSQRVHERLGYAAVDRCVHFRKAL